MESLEEIIARLEAKIDSLWKTYNDLVKDYYGEQFADEETIRFLEQLVESLKKL